jgi:lactoylglutathione lyase
MSINIHIIEIVLYVENQEISRTFYEKIFRKPPDLNVTGMTEFKISEKCIVGLMPNMGIAKIINHSMPHPSSGIGIPRCEVYLYVDNLDFEFENAIESGAKLVSPISDRNWGDRACYFADPDGHIIAFAQKI